MNADVIFGWVKIAKLVGVHEKTAREFAALNRDPLPVRIGHRGAFIEREALLAWIHRR